LIQHNNPFLSILNSIPYVLNSITMHSIMISCRFFTWKVRLLSNNSSRESSARDEHVGTTWHHHEHTSTHCTFASPVDHDVEFWQQSERCARAALFRRRVGEKSSKKEIDLSAFGACAHGRRNSSERVFRVCTSDRSACETRRVPEPCMIDDQNISEHI
jgi:hypothetical protein